MRFYLPIFLITLLSFNTVLSETYWDKAKGPFTGDIRSIDIADNGTIYTGTYGGGLYMSRDNGSSWEQVTETLVGQKLINAIISYGSTVLAAAGSQGIFKSTDNGSNWELKSPPDDNITFKAFVRNKFGNLFAGTSLGIYKSPDNGMNWIPSNNGLPVGSVFSLLVHSNSNMFTCIFPLKGIYKSTDNGQSWFSSNNGFGTGNVFDFKEHPDGSIYIGTSNGIYKSTNNGNDWNKINTGFTGSSVFTIVISNSGKAIAGASEDGIYRSTDGGETWDKSNDGLESDKLSIYSLVKSKNGTLFCGTSYGMYKSGDEGLSWVEINTGMNAFTVRSLVSLNRMEVFAGTEKFGIFRTKDSGHRWKLANNGLETNSVYKLLLDRDRNILAGTSGGVYRSTDNGDNWMPINEGLKAGIVYGLDIAPNGHLFAAVWSWGIYRSLNNGISWEQINAGLNDESLSMHSILISSSGTIFAGSNGGGLYKSTNNGNIWTIIDAVEAPVILSLFEPDNDIILAGTSNRGLWRSSDGGTNWTRISSGFGTNPAPIKAITKVPQGVILAGTSGSGIFKSTDLGLTWEKFNEGLTNLNIEAFTVSENESIFVGTNGSGLWGHIIYVSVRQEPEYEEIASIFPMPIADYATIQFDLLNDETVKVNIYEISGRFCATLFDGNVSPANNRVQINTGMLSNGFYFMDFIVAGKIFTKRIVINR